MEEILVRLHFRTYSSTSTTAWLLTAVGEGGEELEVSTGRVDQGEVVHRARVGLSEALGAIEQQYPDKVVELFIFSPSLLSYVLSISDVFGNIVILGQDAALPQRRAEVSRYAKRLMEVAGVTARDRGDLRVVATDGSVGFGAGSAAWLRSDGRWWCNIVDSTNILQAELAAIANAIHSVGAGTRLLVITDSQAALDAIEERSSASGSRLALMIRGELGQKPLVEVRWARGHQGAGLNDGADRLAKLVRRGAGAINPDIAQRIVSESLQAHAERLHGELLAA